MDGYLAAKVRRRRRPTSNSAPRPPKAAVVERLVRVAPTPQPLSASASGASGASDASDAFGAPDDDDPESSDEPPASFPVGGPLSAGAPLHAVSGPLATSPAGRVVPGAHATHAWFTTCSFATHAVAVQEVFAPPGSSPAGRVLPGAHATHTFAETCAFCSHASTILKTVPRLDAPPKGVIP